MSTATPTLPDPRQVFTDLGKDPHEIRTIELLSGEHNHAIWRITIPEHSYILKWQPAADAMTEIKGYLLLHKLGVPTLPLFGHNLEALLMEDLTCSARWRLATAVDITKAETGRAVANWYKVFHNAGEELLSKEDCPDFMTREIDVLNPNSFLSAGSILGITSSRAWDLAILHIELLKAAVARLSYTLNYNDFFWTNLALSLRGGRHRKAIIFDYHLLGVGMRYSDCRNVTSSLSGAAVPAFWDNYGPTDPREQVLDLPLAGLHALVQAAQMPKFPKWAEDSLARLKSGELERDLIAAIEVAQQIC